MIVSGVDLGVCLWEFNVTRAAAERIRSSGGSITDVVWPFLPSGIVYVLQRASSLGLGLLVSGEGLIFRRETTPISANVGEFDT